MKPTLLARAAAATLCAATFAPPSWALPASKYVNTSEFVGDTLNIRISGALPTSVLTAAVLPLCEEGGLHRYVTTNNTVLFCTANPAAITLPPDGATKLATYLYSAGGSGNGIIPVNSAATLPFLSLPAIDASCAGTSSVADLDGTGPLPSFVDVQCSTTAALTAGATTYLGVSDVEPEFFGGPTSYNRLQSTALFTQILGVPVTRNVYDALQALQIASGQISATCPAGSLSAPCMPSLSTAQVASLYSLEGLSWSALTGIPPTSTADDIVYVARRVSTSGTQKAFEGVVARLANSIVTGRSCTPNAPSFVNGPTTASDTATATSLCDGSNIVVNGAAANQVLTCLNVHQAGNRGAVGVLGTEQIVTAGGSWRFVKFNRVEPTRAAVAAGEYTAYHDVALNQRIGTLLPTQAARGYSAFITALGPKVGDAAAGSPAVHPFGNSGTMGLFRCPSDFTGASGFNPWVRGLSITLNNCATPSLFCF